MTMNIIRNTLSYLFYASLIIAGLWIAIFTEEYKMALSCMAPAIAEEDTFRLNTLPRHLGYYRTNDIIIFKHNDQPYISRIIAQENDSVQITERDIIVNGTPRNKTEVIRTWSGWQEGIYAIDKPCKVPPGHVFVLYDNFAFTPYIDSRRLGPIPVSKILGTVCCIMQPSPWHTSKKPKVKQRSTNQYSTKA